MLEVKFYDKIADELLKFAVIISRTKDKWVFYKHKERDTYEIPGGRREEGETILETANRELYEETGAIKYEITPICVYSVTGKTRVKMLQNVCDNEGVLCHIEQGVGHRMEVLSDLDKNLDIISNVIKRLN